MFQAVLNRLFACTHKRTTFPRTHLKTAAETAPGGTAPGGYVVCLDCGKTIPYDLGAMIAGPAAPLAGGTSELRRRWPAYRVTSDSRAIRPKAPPDARPTAQPEPPSNGEPASEAKAPPGAEVDAETAQTRGAGGPPDDRQPDADSVPAEERGCPTVPLKADGRGAGASPGEPVFSEVPVPDVRPTAQPRAQVAGSCEEIGRSASPTDEGVCPALPTKDDTCGAGASAGQTPLPQRPTPPMQPVAQPVFPPVSQPRVAAPAAPMPRPYLFAAAPAEAAKAPNGVHASAESEVRRYLDRAGLRFRKVQVALRVLNSLMEGAAVLPDDVALLMSWADPSNRSRSPGELARQVVEWAGSG